MPNRGPCLLPRVGTAVLSRPFADRDTYAPSVLHLGWDGCPQPSVRRQS